MRSDRVLVLISLMFVIPIFSSCGSNSAQSETWKVTVYSAKFEHDPNSGEILKVFMNVEYLGP